MSYVLCRMQATFFKAAASLPALPQLAHYSVKKSTAAPAQPFGLSLSCKSIVGQISTENVAASELAEKCGVAQGIALCIHDAAVSVDCAASQVRRSGLCVSLQIWTTFISPGI